MSASAAKSRPRSSTSDATRCLHLAAEVERDDAGDLRRHRKGVRQQHLLELGDHPRGPDGEAEAHRRQRPHLGIRAHHHERAVVVDELERAPRRELPVRLVDHEQRARLGREPRGAVPRSRAARPFRWGCSGCTRTRPTGVSTAPAAAAASTSIAKSAPRSPTTTSVAVVAGDLRVQCVRRLEQHGAPARRRRR